MKSTNRNSKSLGMRTISDRIRMLLILILPLILAAVPDLALATGMENHVFNRPRPQDKPDAEIASQARKYVDVGCDGDLRVNIPLVTIPGKLGFPLNLYYQSGVKMDQSASWVGLGWTFGGWSVKKLTVHGDDNHAYDMGDGRQTRYLINDEYVVSIPGRSITFINTGTVFAPNFVPQMYSRDSLEVEIDSVYTDNGWHTDLGIPGAGFNCNDQKHWYYRKYVSFVLTIEDGTKYVFGRALRSPTVAEARHDLAVYTSYEDMNEVDDDVYIRLAHSENSEWLLTAILSHDYVDGGGDPSNPLDVPHPIVDNKGDWIALTYGDGSGEGNVLRALALNLGCSCESHSIADTTELAFLSRIVTPSSVVKFNSVFLHECRTPAYWRSGNTSTKCAAEPTDRRKDRQLGQILVFENKDELGTPEGDTLYCVQLNYEENSSQVPLKQAYYRWARPVGCEANDLNGEPTLRSVEMGAGLRYLGRMSAPGQLPQRATDPDSCGIKRIFRFTYDDTLDTSPSPVGYADGYNPYHTDFNRYTDWLYGRQRPNGLSLWCPSERLISFDFRYIQSYLESDSIDLFSCAWGDRDFFGYHHRVPWAWSLKKLSTPDGLIIGVTYESDKVMLEYPKLMGGIDSTLWVTGGSRVSKILVNQTDRWWADPNLYEHTEQHDRLLCDTINFTYGTDSRQVGYATSWPGNFYSFERRAWYASQNDDGTIKSIAFINFLPDFASHVVQYPRVVWQFSGNRGRTEQFFTTAMPTADNPTAPHRLMFTDSDTLRACGEPLYYIWWTLRHGVWLDRSPMHGVQYREASYDQFGNEVSFWQRFSNWDVQRAVLFRNDEAEFPSRTLCDCENVNHSHGYIYRNRDDRPFPVGDTRSLLFPSH